MFKTPSFLAKRTFLQVTRPSARIQVQWRHSSTGGGKRHHQRRTNRQVIAASGAVMLALGLSPWFMTQIHSDAVQVESDDSEVSFGALVRSYAVYTMCSIPALVDNSPRLLQLASVPGLRWFTEALVRITFFDQVSRSSHMAFQHSHQRSSYSS
jgi:proline dehydrogenase